MLRYAFTSQYSTSRYPDIGAANASVRAAAYNESLSDEPLLARQTAFFFSFSDQFFEDAMSANDHTTAPDIHEEAHTGPIKTPGQLLTASAMFFIVPVFIIIGLVFAVTKANKTAPGGADTEKAVAMRIQKVGSVEIRDANRVLKTGEEVYKAQCTACHAAGLAGSPKTGDVAAWAPRIKTGYDALLTSALKGKGAMGAQGGGEYGDIEIGRAVVYLTSAAGGKFAEPAAPAAPAAGASAAGVAAPVAAAVAAPAAVGAAVPK